MESPVTGRYIPHKSKKRVFPGSSSTIEAKLEVSSPPVNRTRKHKSMMSKQNEDDMVMISSRTSGTKEPNLMNRIHSPMEVNSRKKGKGVTSSALGGIIELDSDSDDGVSNSYNRKDYMEFLQSHFDNIDLPTGVEASLPVFFDSVKMQNKMTSAKGKHAAFGSSSSTYRSLQLRRDAKKVQSVKKPLKARLHKMPSGSGASSSLNRHGQPGLKVPVSNTQVGGQAIDLEVNELVGVPENGPIIPMEDMKLDQDSGVAGSSSSIGQLGDGEDLLRKVQNFKKFDIVKDHKDHHYADQNSSMQPSKNWAKKIQEEWRSLKKNLPDTIFVRVYESRMDLLRAVIMGVEGTPYHDGLFFFDVCFPSNYPDSPPAVYYHSGGLRINPNLYRNGKVCLSLLNTWLGVSIEKWMPGSSTMLQVLVSIQGLILNEKPYFNEPGYELSCGSVDGEKKSMQYNERTLVLSLKTMVYTMKNPPQHFEYLVVGHFRDRAHAILKACQSYCEGVRIGCVVDKGKAEEQEGRSRRLKRDVVQCMKMLAGEFKQIGVENMEKLAEEMKVEDAETCLSLTQKIRSFFGI